LSEWGKTECFPHECGDNFPLSVEAEIASLAKKFPTCLVEINQAEISTIYSTCDNSAVTNATAGKPGDILAKDVAKFVSNLRAPNTAEQYKLVAAVYSKIINLVELLAFYRPNPIHGFTPWDNSTVQITQSPFTTTKHISDLPVQPHSEQIATKTFFNIDTHSLRLFLFNAPPQTTAMATVLPPPVFADALERFVVNTTTPLDGILISCVTNANRIPAVGTFLYQRPGWHILILRKANVIMIQAINNLRDEGPHIQSLKNEGVSENNNDAIDHSESARQETTRDDQIKRLTKLWAKAGPAKARINPPVTTETRASMEKQNVNRSKPMQSLSTLSPHDTIQPLLTCVYHTGTNPCVRCQHE